MVYCSKNYVYYAEKDTFIVNFFQVLYFFYILKPMLLALIYIADGLSSVTDGM